MRIYEDPSFDLRVEAKEDDSPLTAADKAAHRVINKLLADTDIPVLSEEGLHLPYSRRRRWRRFWLVDPLDGTKEFLKRNGEFTVNIALVEGGSPVLGVVLVPAKDLLYCGIKGLGAWRLEGAGVSLAVEAEVLRAEKADKPLRGKTHKLAGGERGDEDNGLPRREADGPVRGEEQPFFAAVQAKGCPMPCFSLPASYTLVGSRSHMNEATRRHLEQRRQQHGSVEVLAVGSALKICLVAEGSAHEYPRLGPTMEWDTAAGQAVAEAAGARIVLCDGVTPLRYNKADLRNPHFLVFGREGGDRP